MRPTVADFEPTEGAPELETRGLRWALDVGSSRRSMQADDLTLCRGEVRLVRGGGRGHSRLLHILLGLAEVEAGEVRIAGVEVGGQSAGGRLLLRRRIAFVPRVGALLANLGLDANLALLARHHLDLRDAPLQARMAEISDLLELPPLQGLRLADASLDLQRRVAIGRVLALRPPLLLLQEPTLGLDGKRAAALWAIIDRVRLARSMAVLATGEEAPAGTREPWRVRPVEDAMQPVSTPQMDHSAPNPQRPVAMGPDAAPTARPLGLATAQPMVPDSARLASAGRAR